MEDLKNIKVNIDAADLPEVPRKEDGSIDLEAIATGKDEKNFYIVPDDLFEKYYKELPEGTTNQSGTYRAYNKGKLYRLENDNDEAIRRAKAGGEALQATLKARRKISETVQIMLAKRANKEDIERYQLETGATQQDVLVAAMLEKAIEGKDVQAFNSLRDTAGEKPATEVNATIEEITAEDRELLERVNNRLNRTE